jgi:sterol desaturase/sphingolipid hydroxylase (fatty acid hydroxylase superfamily)
MRELFSLLAIVIAGLPLAYYLVYRILTVLFTYFSHANIQLPHALDKAISFVFVSPNTHKFHHHNEMPWTDTNFGNIFSIGSWFISDNKHGERKIGRFKVTEKDTTGDPKNHGLCNFKAIMI